MTLNELKIAVDTAFQYERHPENVDVVITTELPYATCGQLPCTGVKYVGMGFDWKAGQFRITPEDKLMAIKHDTPQKVMKWRENYHCPKCEYMIGQGRKRENIHFCEKCGQEVKWDD